MYGYIPERIYDVIKSDSRFIAIENIVNKHKKSMVTFEDIISSDHDIKNKAVYKESITTMVKLIEEKRSNYLTQYLVNITDLPKKELELLYYNKKELDVETRLFILSELIEVSWDDRSYKKYMKLYNELYEANISDNYSSYVYLKYLYNKTFLVSWESAINEDIFSNCISILDGTYSSMTDLVSPDHLQHSYIEALTNIVPIIINRIQFDRVSYDYINKVDLDLERFNFQYKDYSYYVAKLTDQLMDLALSVRDLDRYATLFKYNVDYINNSLKNYPTLFKGLNFYDKCNHSNYTILIRKYLKIIDKVNVDYTIDNLKEEDKEFILNRLQDIDKVPNNSYIGITNRYVKSIDDYVEANSIIFNYISQSGMLNKNDK